MINVRCMMIIACFTLFVGDAQLMSMFSSKSATAKSGVLNKGVSKSSTGANVGTGGAKVPKDVMQNGSAKINASKDTVPAEQQIEMQRNENDRAALKRTVSSEKVAATAPLATKVVGMNQRGLARSSSSSSVSSQASNAIIENGTKPIQDYVAVLENVGLQKVPTDQLQAAAKSIVDTQANPANKTLLGTGKEALSNLLFGSTPTGDRKIAPIQLQKDLSTLSWENPTNGVPESNIYKSLKIVEDIYSQPFKPETEAEAPYVKILQKKYPHVDQRVLLDYVREFLKDPIYEQKPAEGLAGRLRNTVNDMSKLDVTTKIELSVDDAGNILKVSPLQERYLTLKTLEAVNEKYFDFKIPATIKSDAIQLSSGMQKASSSSTHLNSLPVSNNIALVQPEMVGIQATIPIVKDISPGKGNAQNLLAIVPEATKGVFWSSSPLTPEKEAVKLNEIYDSYKNRNSNLENAFIALNKDILALEKNKTDASFATIRIAKDASKKMEDAIEVALVKKLVNTSLPIDQALQQSKNKLDDVMAWNSKDPLQDIVNKQYQEIYTKADRLLQQINSKFNEYALLDRTQALKKASTFEKNSNEVGDPFIIWSGVVYQLKRGTQAFKVEQTIARNLWNQSKPIEKVLTQLQFDIKDQKILDAIKLLESQYLIDLGSPDIVQNQAIQNLIQGLNDLSMGKTVKKINRSSNNLIELTPEIVQEITKYVSVLNLLVDKIGEMKTYTNALVPEKSKNFDANIKMLQTLQKDVNVKNLAEKVAALRNMVKDPHITIPDIKTAYDFIAFCKQMIEELQFRKAKRPWQKAVAQAREGWAAMRQEGKLSGVGNILAAIPQSAVAVDGILRENVTNSLAGIGIDENSLKPETKDKITAYIQRTIYLLLLFGPLGAGIYGSLSAEEKLRMQKAILRAFWGDVVTAVIVDKTGASESVAATGSVSEILLSAGLNKATGGYNPTEGTEEYKSSLERLQDKLAKQQADKAIAAG